MPMHPVTSTLMYRGICTIPDILSYSAPVNLPEDEVEGEMLPVRVYLRVFKAGEQHRWCAFIKGSCSGSVCVWSAPAVELIQTDARSAPWTALRLIDFNLRKRPVLGF